MTRTDRYGGALPRYVAILVAAVLGLSLFPAAASAQQSADPCEGAPVANEYVDRDQARDVHERNIDCILFRSIAVGSTNAQGQQVYLPLNPVTRGQMASFVANTLVSAGYDDQLPDGEGADEFDDISGNVHRRNINRLARADIVVGVDENSFGPNGLITRQQMASFMVQAAEFALAAELTSDADFPFTDVSASNVHRENINKGEDNALFRGVTATEFRPGINVLRDQMATFLVNLLRLIFDPENAPPVVVISDATVQPGQPVTGEITGDAQSATVSGCGLNNATVNDTNTSEPGIQFSVQIPSSQTSSCTLTFTITGAGGDTFTRTVNVTIESPAGGSTATTRPELERATVGTPFSNPNTSTTCGATNTGVAFNQVDVTFDFDEALTGAQISNALAANFQLVNNDPDTLYNGVCARPGPSSDTVIITFGTPAQGVGASQLENITVATVLENTVTDNQNQRNPHGDAPVGTAGTQSGQPGVTSAPDLLTVSNFRRATVGSNDDRTQVDFGFDEAAFTVDSNNFWLVLTNGNEVQCTAVAGPTGGFPGAGESADESITTNCGAANDPEITLAQVARGFVDGGAVSDARADIGTNCTSGCAGNKNVLQATQNPDIASSRPDLEAAELRLGATSSDEDRVLFRLDEGVLVADPNTNAGVPTPGQSVTTNRFCIYTSSHQTLCSMDAARSTTSEREILVDFGTGATRVESAIGAYILENAVTALDNGAGNREDEVGVTNSAQTQIQPGVTMGPDFTGARIEVAGRDNFTNEPNDYRAILVFDEDLDTTPIEALNAGEISLFQNDGTELTCTSAELGTSSNSGANTVRCNDVSIAGNSGAGASTREAALGSAVAATVDYRAVFDTSDNPNPTGYSPTTGSTAQPRA